MEEQQGAIQLAPEDVRIGQLKYLEIQRLHDLLHAAEADFGRWANATAALYGVGPGYVIGDPAAGFVPVTSAAREEHHHGG
jgi:hypothetical protein